MLRFHMLVDALACYIVGNWMEHLAARPGQPPSACRQHAVSEAPLSDRMDRSKVAQEQMRCAISNLRR
jgi:hypothetical protein